MRHTWFIPCISCCTTWIQRFICCPHFILPELYCDICTPRLKNNLLRTLFPASKDIQPSSLDQACIQGHIVAIRTGTCLFSIRYGGSINSSLIMHTIDPSLSEISTGRILKFSQAMSLILRPKSLTSSSLKLPDHLNCPSLG